MHIDRSGPVGGPSMARWAYLAIFALMALAFAGIPAIGAAVVGWAAVLASQGKLNIFCRTDRGNAGHRGRRSRRLSMGDRWGRELLDHPGRRQEGRQKVLDKAAAVYAKWGRLAVFFTSTIVSAHLRMKYSQFVVWNFIAGAVYVLSVGPAAYGAGKVSVRRAGRGQPGRTSGRAGDRGRVRHARGKVFPPPQGPQAVGRHRRG